MYPVRIAMSGRAVTPGGAVEIALLIGREETLKRLRAGLKLIS
jgi:glutamyl-tRNA synthetase